jgi:hypothetical protein
MITPRRFKISPANGSQPQSDGTANRRAAPYCFSAWDDFETSTVESSDNMKNYHEAVHTLRFSCNSVYIACNLGNGTAKDLGTGILCAVLSQRELSE